MNPKVNKLADIYKAFSEPTRLMIIKLLASEIVVEPCVLDLAQKLNITSAAVSQHMKVLRSIGIVDPIRKGNQVFYTLNNENLKKSKKLIDEMFELAFKKCSLSCNSCTEHE